MRYNAKSYCYDDYLTITDLVLNKGKLSIDFQDNVGEGHLEATSVDDATFEGAYGYPFPEDKRRASFRLYRSSDGGAVLVGRWNEVGGADGTWLIMLERIPKV